MMMYTEIKYLNTRTLSAHTLPGERKHYIFTTVSQMVNDPACRTHLLKATHDGLTQNKIK
jgi:hypothetical protein